MGISACHVKTPPAKPKDSKADSKAKPKPATPKVAAAVAIVAALSSMVTPSQAFGGLFRFANDSHEKLNFSTGAGFKKSSDTIGFQDQDGILGDANHFLFGLLPGGQIMALD